MSQPSLSVEVDACSPAQWDDLVRQFADASLYQTAAYGAVRWGERRLSRLVVRCEGRAIGIAQLAMLGPHRLGAGIAYLRWGPLWRRKDEPQNRERLRRTLIALREEYVVRRRLYLRVLPGVCAATPVGDLVDTAFEGYQPAAFNQGESRRTIVVDLVPPPDVIRKHFEQKWRNQLNRAERNGLIVRELRGGDALAAYIPLHDELQSRKRFSGGGDVRAFDRMQRMLPEDMQMRVMLCEERGVPVAGVVGSALGDTGIYLLGATTSAGMQSKGSYLLQWGMIRAMKENGVLGYDLNGINPEANPGVYHFKAGMGGTDATYLAPRASCEALASAWLATAAQGVGVRVRATAQRLRHAI